FSPIEPMLAIATAEEIVLWNPSNRTKLGRLRSQDTRLNFVNFSADGRVLITKGEKRILEWWSLADSELPARPAASLQAVLSASFLPDSKTVAIGEMKGSIGFWQMEKQGLVEVRSRIQTNSPIGQLGVSKDGQKLLAFDALLEAWLMDLTATDPKVY